ncbi:RING zinc finger protein-like protein [Venturia nashicola]|nr:RING zinc finger protein-like protein [Venturia nashicola]
MSKRQFKAQASSSRAAFGSTTLAFGSPASSTFATSSSSLSYLNELPALSSISDAHTVVAFKNLSKRDSTTKAKALEDLQTQLSSSEQEIEDGVLEAWINIYPRTSIDNSKTVRQLSHNVQGQVCVKSGKRIAKHMPRVVGAWLAGLFDNDKSVSKAASEAFEQVFATLDKRLALWKAYQEPILAHCQQVLDNESAKTLSDERSVSQDEANAKYYRVVTAAVGLLSSLISHVKEEEVGKHSEQYIEILQDKRLWEKSLSEDPAVRRAVHKLLRSLLQSHHTKNTLDLETLSSVYLYKGLESDQNGSASEYLETVFKLTEFDSSVWTDKWAGKKPAKSRLKHFVKRGSQGSTLAYWSSVSKLFTLIPKKALPTELTEAEDILKSLHGGITKKDEPRAYIMPGFQAYVQVADILCVNLASEDQTALLKEHVLPLILQYIKPVAEHTQWDIPGARAHQVIQEVVRMKADIDTALRQEWSLFSSELVKDIKVSLPEQSNDYGKSQDELSKTGERYATILALIVAKQTDSSLKREEVEESDKPIETIAMEVVTEALQVCKNRNGKPYGAANVASAIIQSCKSAPWYPNMLSNLSEFVAKTLPTIYSSPSFKPLASILYMYKSQEMYRAPWLAAIHSTVGDKSNRQFPALQELLVQREDLDQPQMEILLSELAPAILGKTDEVLRNSGSWDALVELLSKSGIVSTLFATPILGAMTHALTSATSEAPTALAGLQCLIRSTPTLIKSFIETSEGRQLLPNVLALTESPDDQIAHSAVDLNTAIHTIVSDAASTAGSRHSLVDVIQDGLNHAATNSLSIDTLVSQAQQLARARRLHSIAVLLPSASSWSSALEPLLQRPFDRSFAIMSPLAGAGHLVRSDPSKPLTKIARDSAGLSIPLRMAMYTVRLLQSVPEAQAEMRSDTFQSLAISLQLANESLSIAGSTAIRSSYTPESDAEIAEFVSECQNLITNWLGAMNDWESEKEEPSNEIVKTALDMLFSQSLGQSPKGFYNAQCYCTIVAELIELHGWHARKTTDLESKLREIRKAKDPLQTTTFLTAYRVPFSASSVASGYCNELLADLDALNIGERSEEGLHMLVILNSILQNQDAAVETIAKQRLVRYGRRFVGWLADDAMQEAMQAEVCRVLCILLPHMSDLYGDHWSNVLAYLMLLWDQANELPDPNRPTLVPLIHVSLKLYTVLRRMVTTEESKAEDERNDDIIEAWKEAEPGIGEGLLQLLKLHRAASDETHQALRIIDEMLARQVSSVPLKHLNNTEELYAQLYSQSRSIQEAAYLILHREVPEKQEQLALETILEKTTAKLPDELLSLILEIPSNADLSEEDFERGIPLQLRGYMFSWLLLFDHFQHASYKVKNDYIEGMKEGEYVTKFLDFAFDFLGHGEGRPVDVSKVDIVSYTPDTVDSPIKDTEWLLTHLYYLCLCHLPSISKTWWIECKSRPKYQSVESWTSRFVSPHVMSTMFDVVSKWTATQDTNPGPDEPPPLVIKVNTRAAELTASYPMDDEQSASIVITLPPTFPLHQATVTSPTKRMAVEEKKWTMWLRNAQAVIAFSNNSLVDGLLAWRRNIYGALKGQTDCAICYSVVGEDGKLPNKTCRTCKNSFHGNCLFKWFKSSNNTTCPLCRNPFNYG